ncbi:MAG: hypothetical protein FDZ70_08130 [Actinobacteria bacterium]|nr:MAG: hypothetical protein FDZ70_08130 [Actinomycetota bacterium]
MARLQDAVIAVLVEVLAVALLVALVWAVWGVVGDVVSAITGRAADGFKALSVEVLAVLIFIELFHSLTGYMRSKRIRITHLVDASLAFVLREVWLAMYAGDVTWQRMLALAGMVLALGGVRTLAVVFSPAERAAAEGEAEA